MKIFTFAILCAALFSALTSGAADANNSLSAKVMADHPGVVGGRAIQPRGKVDAGSRHGAIRQN